MNNWTDLLADLKAQAESTCVEVLEGLLLFIDAGDNPKAFRQIHLHQALPADQLDILADLFRSSLGGPSSGLPSESNAWKIERSNGIGIVEAIEAAGASWWPYVDAQIREVSLAWAAAVAIDDVYGAEWIDAFRDTYDSHMFEVAENRIFPIGPPFNPYLLRRRHGRQSRLTPAPEKRNPNHRVLGHVGLRPKDDFEVFVDTSLNGSAHDKHSQGFRELAEELSRQPGSDGRTPNEYLREVNLPVSNIPWNEHWPRLATALVNRWKELKWTPDVINGHHVIREVHPGKVATDNSYVDENATEFELGEDGNEWEEWEKLQYARCVEVLRLACREKIDVLVFPELCQSLKLQMKLIAYADSLVDQHVPQIIVFGSAHVLEGEGTAAKQENISRTMIFFEKGSSPVVEHRKFNPVTEFRGKQHEDDPDPEPATEQLDPTYSRITLCVGSSSSFCPLICKDCLDTEVGKLWSSLRPNLILVPALSLVSGAFKDAATIAGSTGYCLSVIADNGIDDGDVDPSQGNRRRFATFGLLGGDESGATDAVQEEQFHGTIPRLPRLLVLRWSGESGGGGGESSRPHVEVIPSEQALA